MEGNYNVPCSQTIQLEYEAMIQNIKALLSLFKKGKRLAHPESWKNTQIAAGLLVPVLSALALLAGGDLEITDEQVTQGANLIAYLGVGAYGLFNLVTTVITSNKVGLSDHGEDREEGTAPADAE